MNFAQKIIKRIARIGGWSILNNKVKRSGQNGIAFRNFLSFVLFFPFARRE